MPSRLSSLLVRDGLIGVKRMERAFQRQVIYGGALDTILLEMGLIDEGSLCEYLSLATGLPPATAEQMDFVSSDATDLCDEAKARTYNVAPLTIDNDALRVLVCEPVDFAQLEDLADDLDLAIQPLIVPEFRFHLLCDRAFGATHNARFLKLAETVSKIEPIHRAPTAEDLLEAPIEDDAENIPVNPTEVESATAGATDAVTGEDDDPWAADALENDSVDSAAAITTEVETITADVAAELANDDPDREDLEIVDVPLPPPTESPSVRATLRMSSDAVAARLAAGSESHRISDAYRIVRPARSGETGVPEARDDVPTPREIPLPTSTPSPPAPSPPIPAEPKLPPFAAERGADRFSASYKAMNELGIVSGEISEEDDNAKTAPRVFSRPAGAPLSPLSVTDAADLLGRADERDAIFSLLLRGIASVADYAALLTVQGGSAIGRMALNQGTIDHETAKSVLIPLGVPSPFQKVVQSASPYIGRLSSGVAEVDEQVTILGGVMPPTAVLLPVALRNRVVAIAVGHCGEKPVEVKEVGEAFTLAQAAADALTRLIRKAKERASEMAGATSAAIDAAAEARETSEPSSGNGASGAIVEAPRPHTASAPAPVRDEEIEELLAEVQSDDRATSAAAKQSLLGRASEVVPYLDDHFPGRLLVDRYEVGWRTIRAGQYGHIMDLVVTLGAACGPMLAAKLGDPRRDVRYYAAVCAAELRPEAALRALVERIFDRDYGVRDVAIHALTGYPTRELASALAIARKALDSNESEKVTAAANALAVLGDLTAIPAILDVVAAGRDTTEPARRALRRLTAQDFGANARKWRQWWDKNKARTRVEWLLDALAHKDEDLRAQAVDDLRTLTGESFDFQPAAPKRDRENARREWLDWWEHAGRRRFARARSERDRDTAKLPHFD